MLPVLHKFSKFLASNRGKLQVALRLYIRAEIHAVQMDWKTNIASILLSHYLYSVFSERTYVITKSRVKGFGFAIVGGFDTSKRADHKKIRIEEVTPGGPAIGRLR